MRRGTTPTLSFTTEYKATEVSRGFITFRQNGAVVLEKAIGDSGVEVADEFIYVDLTQPETLSFTSKPTSCAEVQIRLVLTNGFAVASNIVKFDVGAIIKDGVI